jgi:NAD(P)-dependent dehydrogenase (short-subunit alcohol dehydrogenase family)
MEREKDSEPCPRGSDALVFQQGQEIDMFSNNERMIAVIGATGRQGGAVVRALQASSQFKVRALSRNPDKHRELADEVVKADLNRPETLKAAFEGAYGVFLVTNFWEEGTDELKQATAAVRAAKDAGVKHLIWSTLPDVEAISGGKFHVPHFTGKAKIDILDVGPSKFSTLGKPDLPVGEDVDV